MTLYSKALLRLAADAVRAGRLEHPHATGSAHNPNCGDRVISDLACLGGRIVDIALETKACVLAQASASLLAQEAIGLVRGDLVELHLGVSQLLRRSTQAQPPRLHRYDLFAEAASYPSRHRCVLLPIEAVLAAFDSLADSELKGR